MDAVININVGGEAGLGKYPTRGAIVGEPVRHLAWGRLRTPRGAGGPERAVRWSQQLGNVGVQELTAAQMFDA